MARLARDCCKIGVDLGKRGAAIDGRLTLAEQVQVGTVQYEQPGQGATLGKKGG